MGRALCDAAGATCVGDEVVTCAEDADGCLVETRTDCGAAGNVCDDSGGAPACVDPCTMIPEADRCDTDGARACAGETLEACTMDADGCLVLARTQCDDSPGGVCDASGDMPVCALPPDPCASLPAAERCDTEGTSCDGNERVSCAPNAFGCLVVTRTDCTGRDGGACDASGGAAICTATDPCAGVTTCAAAGTSCDGPELVQCAADAFGCLVESRTDCTATTFGFCDEAAAPSAMCSTAAVDPCMGETECGTAPSRACSDGMTLETCAPNAFGCFVTTTTDCTATSEICDATSGTAMCVDACSVVTVCPSASYCEGDDLVSCADDADGCLVESSRTTCDDTCDVVSGTSSCVTTACPEAAPGFIDCTSGTVSGDTAMGTTATAGPYGSCYSGTSYPGHEQYWRFRHSGTDPVEVQIVSTRGSSTADFDLFVLDGGDGTSACTSGSLACLDSSRGTGATETVDFRADPGDTEYVVYDLFGSTGTATTDYTLSVTCTPIVCGDGVVQMGEACDDGGTTAGDGCSGTCTLESGYACSGEPSVCTPSAANSTCATATAITADTTITGENPLIGGPRPTGTGCSATSGSGTTALYYAVTIPANTFVDVQTTPGLDVVLLTQDACDGECTFRTDSAPEDAVLVNDTASPLTRIVVVHNYSSTASGTYDISFTYRSLPTNTTCAAATPITADTTITGENPLLGGPRPSGTGCSSTSGSGTTALFYEVTIPASTIVDVQTTPGLDIVLLTMDSCSATSCTSRTDSSPESASLFNLTSSPITRIVVVENYSATASGTYDISFTYSAATVAPNATCATATPITADTTIAGENPLDGGPRPTGTGCNPTSGSGTTALFYEVTIPASTTVDVQTTPGLDIVLLTMDSCSATGCTSRTDSSPESASLTNVTSSPVTRIVVVHNYSSTASGTYDISFTYSAATVAPNASCATATPITADTTIAGENPLDGGPRPTGTGCNPTSGSGTTALFYEVTIPAETQVEVQTTPGLDIVLLTMDSCSATSCTSRTDSSPERATLSNPTSSPITRIVVVENYSATGSGTYDISFAYSAIPYTAITAACVTGGTWTSLTRSGTGNDATTSITPLPFAFTYFGDAVTHYSTNTNGIAQLWSSGTGTPSTAWSNDLLPDSSTPNGTVAAFWDDLYLGASFDIRTQTVGSAGSQVFVIEWNDALAGSGGDPITFQAHFHEGTNAIELHYCSVGASARATGDSATIGAENLAGTSGFTISYNAAAAVTTGTGYRFVP